MAIILTIGDQTAFVGEALVGGNQPAAQDFLLSANENGTDDTIVHAAHDEVHFQVNYAGDAVPPLSDDFLNTEQLQVRDAPDWVPDLDEDWNNWSWSQAPPPEDADCLAPVVTGTATGNSGAGASGLTLTLPTNNAGDLMVVCLHGSGVDLFWSCLNSGWGQIGFLPNIWAKVSTGGEVSVSFLLTLGTAAAAATCHVIKAGTFDVENTFSIGSAVGSFTITDTWTDFFPRGGDVVPPVEDDKNLFFVCARVDNATLATKTIAEPEWTNKASTRGTGGAGDGIATWTRNYTGASISYTASNVWALQGTSQMFSVRGFCPLLDVIERTALDDQDFTDFTDYGSQSDPMLDDVVVVVDSVETDDSANDDFTDFADYGSNVDPLAADNIIEDFLLGFENNAERDDTDYTDYGFASDAVPERFDPIAPTIAAQDTQFGTQGTSTSITVTAPTNARAGDLIVVYIGGVLNGFTVSAPAGFTRWDDLNAGSLNHATFYKLSAGSEPSTYTFTDSNNTAVGWIAFRVYAGTFEPTIAPRKGVGFNVTGTGANPPLVTGWTGNIITRWLITLAGQGDSTITSWSANYTNALLNFITEARSGSTSTDRFAAISSRTTTAGTEDPGIITLTSASDQEAVNTLAILGAQGGIPEAIIDARLDDQDWTDFTDYGTQTDPLSDDLPEDAAYDDEDDYSTVDDTDYSDYGWSDTPGVQEDLPVVADDPVDDEEHDDQDRTDFADYSFSSDAVGDDLPEDFVLGIDSDDARDDTDYADYGWTDNQSNATELAADFLPLYGHDDFATFDWTDFTDYGTSDDPRSDDRPEDFLPSDNRYDDDQDRTDFTDYGFAVDPLSDDFISQDFLLAADESYSTTDDTDYSDYGVNVDVASDELAADFLPFTPGEDYSAVDDTDYADYGSSVDPLSADLVVQDFLLGANDNDAERDDTDYADYGTQSDPLADTVPEDASYDDEDNDDQDWTDWTDYSSTTDPLSEDAADNAPLGPDYDPPTDDADYGFASDPLSDDRPEDFVLGIDSDAERDDTDYADYGSSDAQSLSTEAPADFILGIDCDAERDDTDYADYGFADAQALATDLAADFILGIDDGTNTGDPTQTDFTDYSSQSSNAVDNLPLEMAATLIEDDSGNPDQTDFWDYGAASPVPPELEFVTGDVDMVCGWAITRRATWFIDYRVPTFATNRNASFSTRRGSIFTVSRRNTFYDVECC